VSSEWLTATNTKKYNGQPTRNADLLSELQGNGIQI
jgi:hypothetical protein